MTVEVISRWLITVSQMLIRYSTNIGLRSHRPSRASPEYQYYKHGHCMVKYRSICNLCRFYKFCYSLCSNISLFWIALNTFVNRDASLKPPPSSTMPYRREIVQSWRRNNRSRAHWLCPWIQVGICLLIISCCTDWTCSIVAITGLKLFLLLLYFPSPQVQKV